VHAGIGSAGGWEWVWRGSYGREAALAKADLAGKLDA
jgi:hypothetical protein